MLDTLLGVLGFFAVIGVGVIGLGLCYLLGWWLDRDDPNWRDRR